MDSRKIILLVGALLVAGLTAFMARSLISGSSAPAANAAAAPIDGPEVLVATRALPIGTILDATALKFQPWPKELVDGAYYIKATTDLKNERDAGSSRSRQMRWMSPHRLCACQQ